jgi:cytochrome c peroxidase
MGMAGRETEIGKRLGRDSCYQTTFARAFPENSGRIDFPNVARALASFERTLISYGSAWDRQQLAPNAQAGSALFARDCAACHSGTNFTDLSMHRLGPADPALPDQGLFEKTGSTPTVANSGRPRCATLRSPAPGGTMDRCGRSMRLSTKHGLTHDAAEVKQLIAFLTALSDTEFTQRQSLAIPEEACGKRL